jgi:hypothetical protein
MIIHPNRTKDSSEWAVLEETYLDASHQWLTFEEFENIMPDFGKVQDMCKEYPALAKAYENFKMVYNLVKDDYKEKRKND